MADELKKLRNGRYELLRKLGEGSQGETFEAVERGLGAPSSDLSQRWSRYVHHARTGGPADGRGLVAIKCFRLGTAKAWKDVELAEREAATLSGLDHPNLPRYVEHFEEEGALYLVMEKIPGESVASLTRNGRSLSADEVTRMLRDIGEALRYLHGLAPPIVHRDIKPGNVIRRPDGSFALVDFGSVKNRLKPSGGSTVVGTFGFMAPEQFQGRASRRSDLYGLAATARSCSLASSLKISRTRASGSTSRARSTGRRDRSCERSRRCSSPIPISAWPGSWTRSRSSTPRPLRRGRTRRARKNAAPPVRIGREIARSDAPSGRASSEWSAMRVVLRYAGAVRRAFRFRFASSRA